MEQNCFDVNTAYIMMDALYTKALGRKIKSFFDDDNNSDLYPIGWFSMGYEIRIAVLQEAIDKKVKITQTESYGKILDGEMYNSIFF
ncbi:MAG: hypothetical protein FWG72_03015 [Oscillospiraceae bacterium]|nr:hypothetical protein [Oscillospiraceae bacterium]